MGVSSYIPVYVYVPVKVHVPVDVPSLLCLSLVVLFLPENPSAHRFGKSPNVVGLTIQASYLGVLVGYERKRVMAANPHYIVLGHCKMTS